MTDSKTIILRSGEQADYAIKLINGLPKSMDKPKFTVTIEKYAKQRSNAQNRTYWMWMREIAAIKPQRIFMTQEKWHYAFAMMFLDPIEVPDLKTGELHNCPRSTKGLNTVQFNEYLKKVDDWAIENGIILPHPDDLRLSM